MPVVLKNKQINKKQTQKKNKQTNKKPSNQLFAVYM